MPIVGMILACLLSFLVALVTIFVVYKMIDKNKVKKNKNNLNTLPSYYYL